MKMFGQPRLAAVALLLVATAASGLAADLRRFAGDAQVAGQAALPLFMEIIAEGDDVKGSGEIPGATFRLVDGKLADGQLRAKIAGDGIEGTIDLERAGSGWTGSFTLGGEVGRISLKPTQAGADELFGPPPQNAQLTPEQMAADLDELVRIITTKHGSPFHSVSASAFASEVARTRAALPTMNAFQMQAAFRRVGTMIGDAHTNVGFYRGMLRTPLLLYWFVDGVRVVATPPDLAWALGAQVEAIGGAPISEILGRMEIYRHRAEPIWTWKSLAPSLLTRPALLREAGVPHDAVALWTLRLRGGERSTIAIAPRMTRESDWVSLGGRPPVYLQRPGEGLWVAWDRQSASVYANWRSYDDLAVGVSRLMAEVDARRPKRLIIDLRDNGGGDGTKGRAIFLSAILARPWLNRPDRLFILVGRETFSAAMVNAIDFGRDTNATLVGEPIGERPNSWQESRRFFLPNSGLAVAVSTKFYRLLPKNVGAFSPDRRIDADWHDWARGCDTVLKSVAGLCAL